MFSRMLPISSYCLPRIISILSHETRDARVAEGSVSDRWIILRATVDVASSVKCKFSLHFINYYYQLFPPPLLFTLKTTTNSNNKLDLSYGWKFDRTRSKEDK